jgi:uncharacterized protein
VRLVLDTNIVVSALLWRGTPYRLLEEIRQRAGVQLFSSTPLLEELADVLGRPTAARRLAAAGRSALDVLTDYTETVDLVSPVTIDPVIIGDPDDDVVLATAIAAQAHFIVSGDRDLLSLSTYQGIEIVNAMHILTLVTKLP